MNHAHVPPQGPPGRSLTELSGDDVHRQIERQMGRWRTHGLDDVWYNLLCWFVSTRDTHWRRVIGWNNTYRTAEGDLDYRTWFSNLHDRGIYYVLDMAVWERKRIEEEPSAGPLAAERSVMPPANGALSSNNQYKITTTSANTVDRLNVNKVLGQPTDIFDRFWQRNDAAGLDKPRYKVHSLTVDDNGTLNVVYVQQLHHLLCVAAPAGAHQGRRAILLAAHAVAHEPTRPTCWQQQQHRQQPGEA